MASIFILNCAGFTTVSVSIPKCGSHLVTSLLRKMLDVKVYRIPRNYNEDRLFQLKNFSESCVYWGHCWPTNGALSFFSKQEFKGFVVIRDPRDQILSYIDWIYRQCFCPDWICCLPYEDLYHYLVTNPAFFPGPYFSTTDVNLTLAERYKIYLKWAENSNFCIIRYEDLVGPYGGGSLEIQLATIEKIADHLGILVLDDLCKELAGQLYGGTSTFNKGKIGRWKEEFTPEMKEFFKKHFSSEFLIELGYETSLDW